MKYAQIRKYDVANGEGIRTVVFVTGCTHACKGCFNQKYQDFDFGKEWTKKETFQVINYLSDEQVDGLTILGGEPFQNEDGLIEMIKTIKVFVDKNIWIYSGYTYNEILADEKKLELLKLCDVLVDGKFELKQKNLKLRFRGSANQKIIDIKKSLSSNDVVEYILS